MQPLKFGLPESTIQEIDHIFDSVKKKRRIFSIWIFGSRATGKYRPYSDIDFLIEANPPLTLTEKEKICEAFEESSLPYKIDLVLSEELLNEYRDSIYRTREQW